MSMFINKNDGSPIKIASILDKFSYECLKYECHLIPIGMNNWEEIIKYEKPDMLLVQSAWEGNDGQWKYKIKNLHLKKDAVLKHVVNYCKEYHIPTVFWNKEDPYHFNYFIGAAILFDYIFTTDVDSIDHYIKRVKHHRVFSLPFGIQPKIHNPVNKDREKIGEVAFAGTWYGNGHEDRKKDMEIILKPALEYGVDIYDRMYHYKRDDSYRFPQIYRNHIKGYIPYDEIASTYKKYNVVLNVNTIQNSSTMFAGRVLELLACGINVVSGYALGIDRMLPGLVKMSKNQDDTKKYLDILLGNRELRDRLSLLGIRYVLNNHTYRHRFETILDKIGITYKRSNKPGISIIVSTNRESFIDNVFENYERQNYDNKELIIILNNNSMNIIEWKQKAKKYNNIRIFQIDEKEPLGACLNFAVEKGQYDYIFKMDDDDYYGPEYCGDLMDAFIYTEAQIVGKYTHFVYFENTKALTTRFPHRENRYVKFVTGSTITFKREVFKKVQFATDRENGSDTKFLEDAIENGFKIYSTDRFNHVTCRRGTWDDHTWKISDEEYLRKCSIIGYTNDYITHSTV